LTFVAHPSEVLALDWNKYQPQCLVTGGVDKTVRIFDTRNTRVPRTVLHGHEFAVKIVKFSPHSDSRCVSSSYDTSIRVWDHDQCTFIYQNHSEFVMGLDLSLFHQGSVVSCGFDEQIQFFQI
jgi:peroxin-7